MVDIHCHILPGIDDGPRSIEDSVALARAAVAAGTSTVVATPHIREDHPFDPATVPERVEELSGALRSAGVDLVVMTGGEVALSQLDLLDDAALGALCLGDGSYVLIESPYGQAGDMLDRILFDVQMRGFRPILAHPERSPTFQSDPSRLARLVEAGALCSITASSMAGRFGGSVRAFTARLLRDGLVHDVASDAHDVKRRPPGALDAFSEAERDLRGIDDQQDWYLRDAPAAIVMGRELPPRPPTPRRRGLFR
jgi:protein-tyrosine phosphatase